MDTELQALFEIVLPPGSTSADLQAAVNSAASGDIIIISGDMPFSGTVTIPVEKEITIQSDTGNNWVMSAPGSRIRHFTVRGSLTLQNIILDGGDIGGGVVATNGNITMNNGAVVQNCRSNVSGGGINVNNGSFTMNEGAVVQNCYSAGSGGGAYVNLNSTITINGGVIKGNTSAAAGAGIMFQESTFTMTAGEFSGNTASASGGAIQMLGRNTVTISGGIISGNSSNFQGGGIGIPTGSTASISNVIISGNTAKSNGGGIFIQGAATMSNVTISGNKANARGGGIYSYAYGKTEITGESYITNNNAPNGGGIYTAAATYNNLVTGSETVFHCNWASTAYQPPIDAGTLYPDIMFSDASITDHPLNNFDINYNVGEPLVIYVNITYDANGGVGDYKGPDIIPGATDIVLNLEETGITRPGYILSVWNTQPDGTGISYTPGEAVTLGCSAVLFAQWIVDPTIITVTYSPNGGSGGYVETIKRDENYTVLSASQAGIGRTGFTFTGWNTQSDGSGATYTPGETVIFDSNAELFAQWAVEPKIYTVTYDCNGGSGRYTDHCREFELNYVMLSTTQTGISRTGSTFTVWNTLEDGSGIAYASGEFVSISANTTFYAQWRQIPEQKRLCRAPVAKFRKAIEGQKLWVDNDNAGNTRPPTVEIILMRDGEIYRRANVDSTGDGYFGFCCLPVWKNSSQKYIYQIDETTIPNYTKTIEGYNIINTLTP